MKEYTCYRCGFQTTHKSTFQRHLNRKNICSPDLENITINDVKIKNNIDFSIKKLHKNSNSLQISSNSLQNTPKYSNKLFKCEYCESEFNRKDNLTKHIKRRRKEKKTKDKEEDNKKQEEVSLLKEELKKRDEELRKKD